MPIIDWRELYASNRAAIAASGVAPGSVGLEPDEPAAPSVASPRVAQPAAVSTALRTALPKALPAALSTTPPGALSTTLPGALPTTLPGALPTALPTALSTALPGAHRSRRLPGASLGGGDRRLVVHVPAGLGAGTAVPLVCMLHGCTQDAASFAAATRMNEAADRHGFVVVYAQQGRGENPQGCWNWFVPEHQARGAGEPAWIAGAVREAAGAAPVIVDARRVFVAGLSAGGAMAAILARAYPDVFAAVAVHSGLAPGSAANMGEAFSAMARGGAGTAPGARGHGVPASPVPTMVIQGSADRTVAPVNAEHVLRDAIRANALGAPEARDLDPTRPSATSRGQVDGGYPFTHARWTDRRGALLHELLLVDGLGHAWSGGAEGGSFTDPRGPDATEAILRFFAAVTAGSPEA